MEEEIHTGLKQLLKEGIRPLFLTSSMCSYSVWDHISCHFTTFTSVLVTCHYSLLPQPPSFYHFGREKSRSFYTPLSTIPQGRDSLVSLPSDWWGCSLLLEDSIEHDCFQPPLVLRKTKLYSKLPSTRSINPVSCFIISKLVLSEFSKNK